MVTQIILKTLRIREWIRDDYSYNGVEATWPN